MPRKQDPISRILNDYASLDAAGRSSVKAALRGYEIGSGNVGTTARRSPVTPRTSTRPSGTLVPTQTTNE